MERDSDILYEQKLEPCERGRCVWGEWSREPKFCGKLESRSCRSSKLGTRQHEYYCQYMRETMSHKREGL